MIHEMEEFIDFFKGVRARTMNYLKVVPDSTLDWRPAENKFSMGELLRHFGSSEVMFLRVLKEGVWVYPGHDESKGNSVKEISEYLKQCHERSIEDLQALGNDVLTKKFPTLHGFELSGWRILMSIAEHEIHHRGQLSTYLQSNHVQPPQVFGLKLEKAQQGDDSSQ